MRILKETVSEFINEVSNFNITTWLLVIGMLVICFVAGTACSGQNGVVALEDWEHGRILCGSEEEGGFLMVNAGHFEDYEVRELITLSKIQCNP